MNIDLLKKLEEARAELTRRGLVIERQQEQIVTLAFDWDRMRSALEQVNSVLQHNPGPEQTEQILAQVQAALTPNW